MLFLRKSRLELLPVAMSAVRMGERTLQVEIDDASVSGAIAAKVGLSGNAAIAVSDEQRAAKARSAGARAGVLVDVQVTPLHTLPFADEAFDALLVHSRSGWLGEADDQKRQAVLGEGYRVLRGGGRILIVEAGARSGPAAWLRPRRTNEMYETAGGAAAALRLAGFTAARVLADREGYLFTEGLKA